MEPEKDERRLHIVFRGEVQGVGFRWNALRVASDLGLTSSTGTSRSTT